VLAAWIGEHVQDPSPTSEISLLLARWREGDPEAMNRLFALVYDELRRCARKQRAGRRSPTLSTTALVHETFLKLVDRRQVAWSDRKHFFAVASLAMRHILVDHARQRRARKRGDGVVPEPLDEASVALDARADELLALDAALESLKSTDQRLSQVVELKFFGGLTFEAAAEVLDLSPRTVKREWRKARALLFEALAAGAHHRAP
jgi:RNA polymerase sigma factor (TIGR02999 family)